MSKSRPTVYVVDDDEGMCESLRFLIKSIDLSVKCYRSAEAFLKVGAVAGPACLVADIRMPGMSGLELQETLAKMKIRIPIIIITGYGSVPTAVRAVKGGAIDFLEKPFDDEVFLERIRVALEVDARRQREQAYQGRVQGRLELLTQREREVMDLVVAGKLNKEIGAALNISERTVEIHRGRVMRKLQLESVSDLVRLYVAWGESEGSG